MPVKHPFNWEPYQEDKSLRFESHRDKHQRNEDRPHGIDLPIVGIDGEGYTNKQTGEHHYDLIAAAGAGWTEHKDTVNVELTPEEIFEFLLGLTDKYGKALFFIYGGSYDFNMWIKLLFDSQVVRIAGKKKRTKYHHYKITMVPKREILIEDLLSVEAKLVTKGKNKGRVKRRIKRKIHIYDVVGFFQSPFVEAVEDWKTTPFDVLEDIARMKKLRGSFTPDEKARILEYCLKECVALVDLGNAFKDACIKAQIRPRHWYGAGALASTLLEKYHIKDYLAEAPYVELKNVWAHAYFGGRTEVSWQGRLSDNGAYQYDINSAYPTAMYEVLPCLSDASWRYYPVSSEEAYKQPYAIWEVRWETHGKEWNPFPYRMADGRIYYPDSGHGYYHKVEIDAAERLYPDCTFQIGEGWVLTPNCEHKPFAFIGELAAYRLKLKAEGDPAHKPLKLGLNSLYGKTAQTVGKHPFQNFYWAGLITAVTRAKLLDAMRYCKGHIYSVATDGLISSVQIPELPVGVNLGQWESTKINNLFLVRPGVYKWQDNYNKWHYGTRGFTTDEADWEAIEKLWHKHDLCDGCYLNAWKFRVTRFITFTNAYHRSYKDWRKLWCRWIEQERKLNYAPTIGSRWYKQESNPGGGIPGRPMVRRQFEPLVPVCHCNDTFSAGVSAMYKRLTASDFESLDHYLLDEEQP